MKTLTVTFHHGNNYGALFQMYALHSTIKSLGHDNIVLETRLTSSKENKALTIRGILRTLFIRACRIYRAKKVSNLNKYFADFKNNHVALTIPYTSMEELIATPPIVEALITGSDQVWNMTTIPSMIPSRFLDFGNPQAIRFSFAASIENMSYSESQIAYVKEQLKKFKGVSLREQSACRYIESITNIRTTYLLDPVFLLERRDWESLAKKPRLDGPYILCYQVLSSRKMQIVLNSLKKETGYPVVAVCNVPFKWVHSDYTLFDVSPEEFIGLYCNASYVVTTSFHGTALGILFNKPTYSIPRSDSSNRIYDLMQLFGLEKFIVQDEHTLSMNAIDWKKINGIIKSERSRSLQFLHDMLD